MVQTNTLRSPPRIKKVETKQSFCQSPNSDLSTWDNHLFTYIFLAFPWALKSTEDELNSQTDDKESLCLTLQGRTLPGPSFWICPSMMPLCAFLTTKPFVGYNYASALTVCL